MRKYLLLIIPFVLISSALLLFKSSLLNIKDVQVKGAVACASLDQISRLLSLKGMNLWSVDSMSLEKKVKNKYLCVDSLSVKRIFPDKIEVNLVGRQPALALATVKLNLPLLPAEATPSSQSAFNSDFTLSPEQLSQASGSAKFIADKGGFLFSKVDSIPDVTQVILLDQDLKLGQKLTDLVQGTLKVIGKLQELSLPASNPVIKNDSLLIDSQNQRFLFNLKGDLDRELASLQLILQKSKMNSQDQTNAARQKNMIKSIDLRFEKPVVIYSHG